MPRSPGLRRLSPGHPAEAPEAPKDHCMTVIGISWYLVGISLVDFVLVSSVFEFHPQAYHFQKWLMAATGSASLVFVFVAIFFQTRLRSHPIHKSRAFLNFYFGFALLVTVFALMVAFA
jgi:hypothetical protein